LFIANTHTHSLTHSLTHKHKQSTAWVRKTAEKIKFKSVSSEYSEGGREGGDAEVSDANNNNNDDEFVQMSPVDADPIMHLEYVKLPVHVLEVEDCC
jgi:hypothetical protein